MNKMAGSLLGLHVGDSLGASLEFLPPRKRSSFHKDIIGGGKHNWIAGDPTDDTEMMNLILESLVERGEFDLFDLSSRFIEWWSSEPKDMGRTTYFAIERMVQGIGPSRSGLSGPHDQGNGSLMRCAPLAFFDISDPDIIKQTAITHNHELCHLSDLILIHAIRLLSIGEDKWSVYELMLNKYAHQNSLLFIHFNEIPHVKWHRLKTSPFVVESICAAFWGLLQTNSFEEALIKVVNRGDDADSVGAITGALCGAHYGLLEIPERWLQVIRLKKRILSNLAKCKKGKLC
jgi:ADP-ribosyl-[dinitrogen reductase] hydrolase